MKIDMDDNRVFFVSLIITIISSAFIGTGLAMSFNSKPSTSTLPNLVFPASRSTIVSFSLPVNPAKYQNEPTGFRNLNWGYSFEEIKDDMLYTLTDNKYNGINYYLRKNDRAQIGTANVSIFYGFWQNKLCLVQINASGYTNWFIAHNSLAKKFSKPYRSNPYSDDYYWFGNNTTIHSEYNELTHNGKIMFSSIEMKKLMISIDKQAIKQSVESGF